MPSLDFQNGFILGLASKGKAKQRTIINTEIANITDCNVEKVVPPTSMDKNTIVEDVSVSYEALGYAGLPIDGLTATIDGAMSDTMAQIGSTLSVVSDDFDVTKCDYQWYKVDPQSMTKYAHTPNISDDGVQNGNYGGNYYNTQVITIPGAEQLNVTLKYGTESISYDWVAVFAGNYPSYTASSSGYIQKLGGSDSEISFTVEGDSVTFAFRSDGSGVGSGYGYYAVVTGEGFIPVELSTEETYTVTGDEIQIYCTLTGARGLVGNVTTNKITEFMSGISEPSSPA